MAEKKLAPETATLDELREILASYLQDALLEAKDSFTPSQPQS